MCALLRFFRTQNGHTLADVGFVTQIAIITKFTRFCSIRRSSANFWGEPHLERKRSGPDFANSKANSTWERAHFGPLIAVAVQTLYFVVVAKLCPCSQETNVLCNSVLLAFGSWPDEDLLKCHFIVLDTGFGGDCSHLCSPERLSFPDWYSYARTAKKRFGVEGGTR